MRIAGLAELVRRVVGFSLVPALSVLSPLLVLPLVASRFGPAGWSAVAVGQSVGAAVSIVVGLSWPTIGAHLIASAPDAGSRQRVYGDSLVSRLVAMAVLSPLGAVASALLAPEYRVAAALAAVAVASNGLTCAWYFVGTARPRSLLINEALVRMVSTGLVALLLFAGAGLWALGLTLLVGGMTTVVLNHRTIHRSGRLPRPSLDVLRGMAARHGWGTGARMVYGIYSSAAVSLVALAAPGAVAGFSAIDRVLKTSLNGLYAVPQGVAGWVSGGDADTPRRALRATAGMVAIALVILVASWVAFPFAIHLLYAGRAEWTSEQRILAAVVLSTTFLGQALVPVLLVPAGRENLVYTVYTCAAVVGTPSMLVLAATAGVTGALAATVLVEFLHTGTLLVLGLREWRRGGQHAEIGRRRTVLEK